MHYTYLLFPMQPRNCFVADRMATMPHKDFPRDQGSHEARVGRSGVEAEAMCVACLRPGS
jgi:hypothetical protein